MSPTKRWYLEMRLAGYSDAEIKESFTENYRGVLQGNLASYLEGVRAAACRFQEEAPALVGRVAEMREGESAAVEETLDTMREVAGATFGLLGASKTVKAEMAAEMALRQKLRAQIEELKKAPKRPFLSALTARGPKSWEKSGPGGAW